MRLSLLTGGSLVRTQKFEIKCKKPHCPGAEISRTSALRMRLQNEEQHFDLIQAEKLWHVCLVGSCNLGQFDDGLLTS
jgi:hypothetical protein